MATKFRILSIDGGGLRGVVPLTILKKVEEKLKIKNGNKDLKIWEYFDFFAGTSTGGLITSAITLKDDNIANQAKYTLDNIMEVYLRRGKEIFPRKNRVQKLLHAVYDIFKPSFSDAGIKKVFSDVLGNATMNDCLKPIMISTYDLTNNIPLFFKSVEAKNDSNLNARLYDICRATSAGPTYLPTYSFHYPKNPDTENPNRNCIDGGVYVNNPSLAALSEILKNKKNYSPDLANLSAENIHILSVGTGSYTEAITSDDSQKKGEIYWATKISDIMMKGVNRVTDYEMKQMMKEGNYLRLNIDIDNLAHSEMTNSTEETTNYLIKSTQTQILNNNDVMSSLDRFIDNSW